MKNLLFIIIIALSALNVQAFWSDGLQRVASLPKGRFIATDVSNAHKVPILNAEVQQCLNSCSIDEGLLNTCHEHADNTNEAKCVSFAKRECLMRCKEKEFEDNALSLLDVN